MRNFIKDFKKFISRGNILDMAIGVIIGAAFGKIVTSLVNDILMPLVTWALGASSLADLAIPLKYAEDGIVSLSWNYGSFIQTIIDFLIIALCIFIIMKLIIKSRKVINKATEEVIKGRATKQEKQELVLRGVNIKNKQEFFASLQELRKENKQPPPPKPETSEDVLKDIRDLLKQQVLVQPDKEEEKLNSEPN